MIIGITGLAQAGKDTAAAYLIDHYGFQRKAFADKLKSYCYLINPDLREAVNAVGWEDVKKIPVYRRFLQDVGHQARTVFGDDFWIDQVLEKRDEPYEENIVITDVRYPNEFDRVHWLGGWTLRIIRPGQEPVNNHTTETIHKDIRTSFVIVNETFERLYQDLDAMMNEILDS